MLDAMASVFTWIRELRLLVGVENVVDGRITVAMHGDLVARIMQLANQGRQFLA